MVIVQPTYKEKFLNLIYIAFNFIIFHSKKGTHLLYIKILAESLSLVAKISIFPCNVRVTQPVTSKQKWNLTIWFER